MFEKQQKKDKSCQISIKQWIQNISLIDKYKDKILQINQQCRLQQKIKLKKKYDIYFKMINHHTMLKDELKKIGSNINKKHAVLRKQIFKTSEVFDHQQIPVFPYQVCFGLFKEINQTKSLSSSMLFLPFLQNIINLGFSNSQMSREILSLLSYIKSLPKFASYENEIKIQQILAILVSKNCIGLNNMNFTHNLFNIVLGLQNIKYKQVWIKSSIILYQSIALLINDLQDNQSEQKYTIFYQFIQDLIKIIKCQNPSWLTQFADQYLVLQIISQSLDQKYFIQNSQIKYKYLFIDVIDIIRKQIIKCIDNNSNSFMVASRVDNNNSISKKQIWQLSYQNKLLILMRVGCKINMISKIGLDILQQIIKIISQKKSSVNKTIAYQTINYLLRNPPWMLNLFQSQYANLFNFLLTTQFNTIKYIFSDQKQKIDLSQLITHQTNYNKILGSNSIDIKLCQFNHSIEVKMIVKNLQEVTFALYSIYSQKYKIDMNEKMQGKPPLQKTYKFCEKTVFETIKAILSKQLSQDTLQSLLKIAQKFINISGCFNDSSISAKYIKLMCKYCLPNQFKNICHQHIQINKMILSTANCLGHLLTSSCWVIVWKALQNYSIYYNRYLLSKEQLQSARQSDVQILYKSMDSIFTESANYNDKYLLQIIRSLIEVAYECLENNFNDESRKIFAFQRIEQIYKLNLFRINIIWPELSSSLLCITTSKVLYFRLSALSLLNILIPISLNYLKTHSQALKSPFQQQNYEQLILEPWINLVNCQFQEIKDEFIIAVNKLIIDYGHIMTNGWRCIMQIVKKTNDLKSLQVIVETFLQKVHDNIMDLIICIDQIQRKLQDTNQKYLCLTMIWSIADYASKNNQLQVLKKIYQILLVPEQMFNLDTQARHSSFYIFAEIAVHNCSQKQPQFWEWIFGEIKKFYSYGVIQCINAKDKAFAEEALKNILTNLIKIYKKFFKVSKQWEENQICKILLADFYKFCSSVLQFRSPQIYQCITKQVKQILLTKIRQSIVLKQFSQFLQNLTQIYYAQNDNKILKCLITYLPPDIYDLLTITIQGINDNFIIMYKLMEKIFFIKLQAQEKDIKLQQLRIFFQQKNHYQYMKKMHAYIADSKPNLVSLYVQHICKTIHKLKLYEDYWSLSQFLPFLANIHIKYLDILATRVLDTMRDIIRIRSQQNWIKSSNHSKDIPIWYICSQDLMKIANEYLQKNNQSWKISYVIFVQILKQNTSCQIDKYSKDSISFFYQIQIQITYFLFENYYFSNKQLDIQNQRQNVQQIGKIIMKRSLQIQGNDLTRRGYNAYLLIFKIASLRAIQNYTETKIEQNQSIIVGILFERITKTFSKIKIGQNQLIHIEQLKFILKQIQNLKLKSRILLRIQKQIISGSIVKEININSKVLSLQTAHLFYFQPFIAKCVRCQDIQTLQIIQNILEKNSYILLNL